MFKSIWKGIKNIATLFKSPKLLLKTGLALAAGGLVGKWLSNLSPGVYDALLRLGLTPTISKGIITLLITGATIGVTVATSVALSSPKTLLSAGLATVIGIGISIDALNRIRSGTTRTIPAVKLKDPNLTTDKGGTTRPKLSFMAFEIFLVDEGFLLKCNTRPFLMKDEKRIKDKMTQLLEDIQVENVSVNSSAPYSVVDWLKTYCHANGIRFYLKQP